MNTNNFTWLNKQGVRSDAGFEVQFIERFCVEYREANRTMSIECEPGMSNGEPCTLISPDCFTKWDDMPDSTALSPDEQKRIEENFREAMEFQGVPVLAQYPE